MFIEDFLRIISRLEKEKKSLEEQRERLERIDPALAEAITENSYTITLKNLNDFILREFFSPQIADVIFWYLGDKKAPHPDLEQYEIRDLIDFVNAVKEVYEIPYRYSQPFPERRRFIR